MKQTSQTVRAIKQSIFLDVYAPGGRMVPRYVLQLCIVKIHNIKIDKNSTTTKAREEISTDMESLEF
jgi:NADH:ubiquinone oxidoreductase subunit B-like Fe-S oxidoreductase